MTEAALWPAVGSFACALLVLESSADKFVDQAAVVAKSLGISEVLIGLLTAGAEWEELMVVVISLLQHRPSLAIGNIIGSSISNILGAFSLGLLFQTSETTVFDRSSRIYSLILLPLTVLVAIPVGLEVTSVLARKIIGAALVFTFVLYLLSIAYLIQQGMVTPPEDSDSDSDSDDGSDDDDERDSESENSSISEPLSPHSTIPEPTPSSRTPLLSTFLSTPSSTSRSVFQGRATHHRYILFRHSIGTIVSFLLLLLASYVLTSSSINIVTSLHLSDAVFGVVILSIVTTLPEKFIATVAGRKGASGIVVANTVGSNVFLLTLCLGVWFLSSEGRNEGRRKGSEKTHGWSEDKFAGMIEAGILVASTVLLTIIVGIGSLTRFWARITGAGMLAAYAAFIALEFTVLRRVGA